MNKLVSKNPVLRFKLGKIILKFLLGKDFPERFKGEKYLYNNVLTLGNVLRAFNFATNPAKTTIKATAPVIYKNLSWEEPKKFRYKGKVYSIYKGKVYNLDRYGKPISEATGFNLVRNSLGRLMNKINTPLEKLITLPELVTTPENKSISDVGKQAPKTTTTVNKEPRFWSKYSFRANEIDPNDIVEWQKKLKVKDDGIWGDRTEAAYLKYLQSKNENILFQTPELSTNEQLLLDITTSRINFNQPNKSSAPFIYDLLLAAKEQAEKSSNNQYIPQEVPELFLAMLTGKYKKGGQLPSRNPVKRFKRNFRLVAQ